MQVRKLGNIKPTTTQMSSDAKISTLEAKLGITFQPEQGHVKKKDGETPKETKWEKNRIISAATHQALGAKHKEPS